MSLRITSARSIFLEASDRIWALPDGSLSDDFFQDGLETLEDYGYIAKAGYFVWNREKDRYRAGFKPRSNEVPLFWAHNVVPNAICEPCDRARDSDRIGLVKIAHDCTAIIRTDAILLQRTSNRRQKRRVIAGIIRKSRLPGNRGFVSENHTILIVPDPHKKQAIPLKMLCRLLNTAAVDRRHLRTSKGVREKRGTPALAAAAGRRCRFPCASGAQPHRRERRARICNPLFSLEPGNGRYAEDAACRPGLYLQDDIAGSGPSAEGKGASGTRLAAGAVKAVSGVIEDEEVVGAQIPDRVCQVIAQSGQAALRPPQ